jgi:hypothetical protein
VLHADSLDTPPECVSLFLQPVKKTGASRENDVRPQAIRALSFVLAAVGLITAAAPVRAEDKITVWWGKGFYKSEDDALLAAIKKFEANTGIKVELSRLFRHL